MASADVGGSSTVPLTFSQGLAVLCSVLGVYSLLFTVRSSGVALLACVSSLLQVVCDISSCWSFSGLDRVVGLFGFPLPSSFFFFCVAVQAFCLSDGEELLGVLCSQEEARQ